METQDRPYRPFTTGWKVFIVIIFLMSGTGSVRSLASRAQNDARRAKSLATEVQNETRRLEQRVSELERKLAELERK